MEQHIQCSYPDILEGEGNKVLMCSEYMRENSEIT